MSMNFNNSGPVSTPPPATPKKNHTKTVAVVVIIGFITMFAAIGLYQETQKTLNNIVSAEPEAISTPTATAASSDLEQKLFTKCKNLEDWYKSLDGLESTNYHCDKYAKGWAGLIN